jgi:hypothetical protein
MNILRYLGKAIFTMNEHGLFKTNLLYTNIITPGCAYRIYKFGKYELMWIRQKDLTEQFAIINKQQEGILFSKEEFTALRDKIDMMFEDIGYLNKDSKNE